MELYDKLNKTINKICYEDHKVNIKIFTDEKDNIIINKILNNYKNASISNLVDDIDPVNIFILYYNNGLKRYDDKIMKFINNYIERNKTFILIVNRDFDFDYIVKSIKANSVDAISWYINEKKHKEYIIVIRKD